MEIVQGKATDKKIIIAQEIAFAKVLAGNNKTLRDQALKKLKKWLKVRGHGKWAFTEEEFIRIWTGLFYCMWMSDKFLVQEELAENISQLIHCFRKNQESALLFIKCFNKRLLMEYEGLDQYRVDKFHMLIRRFLRQTFEYCKRLDWEESFLKSITDIISDVIFHKDNTLGYVLHFMNIYPEELAKVSQGKLQNKTVLLLLEPFLRCLARTKEDRIQIAAIEFFTHLMQQTDAGIEFDEKFKAWKQMGFPGRSINCIKRTPVENGHDDEEEDDEDEYDDDDDREDLDKPLDPRAGSVHVDLPQIPIDFVGLINLFRKYEHAKQTTNKSKRKIRELIQKFSVLKKGRFPARMKKDEIMDEKKMGPRLSIKTAKRLMQYTEEINSGAIKTKEFAKISKELERQQTEHENENEDDDHDDFEEENDEGDDVENEDEDNVETGEISEEEDEIDDGDELDEIEPEDILKNTKDGKKKSRKRKRNRGKNKSEHTEKGINIESSGQKKKKLMSGEEVKPAIVETEEKNAVETKKKRKKKKKKKANVSNEVNGVVATQKCEGKPSKKRESLNGNAQEESPMVETPSKKNGVKRKILSTWQVQELDTNSSEYKCIKPQKVIKLELKRDRISGSEENQEPNTGKDDVENVALKSPKEKIPEAEAVTPVFWNKAKAKVFKTDKSSQKKLYRNPLALGGDSDSAASLRRISFALDKNMAQENDEYLEEVRNSPKVPFDGSKKPIQSALKSGLSPSPINPFYRLKKIKF
ncbi:hypothetical protein RUM44_003644 [Polyplax serrata]|uniref:Uncharacterized protein n=1 Tax=Polyplax serrata TaxID=468196 RepID=A0ABR1AH17_POLSC